MSDQRADDGSVVGRDTRVEGAFTSTGALRIHGHLKGSIRVDGEVSVASGSEVQADIEARSINLAGRVQGNLVAPGSVVLPARSHVDGDVRAESVTVHGVVNGDVVAAQKATLGSQARLTGDVTCRSLVIEEGARFVGRSNMSEPA
ncbi:MAG TPA: polymer-forming cytoskeletal protein [Actinomycetota bacterium]|nr:polymer-forming cytoskeletal protein [Actinomycetota bacterium]